MTRLDRDLERLFAADASARVVRAVAVAPRRSAPPLLTFALAGGAVALAIVAALSLLDPSARVASPPLIPLSTPSASPTPDPCADPLRRQQVDPVVGGSKLPGAAAAGIHAVRVAGGEARWPVVFAVGPPPEGGGPLDVAPRATLRGPDGIVPILGYEAGPDGESTTPTTATLRVLPCGSAVLLVRTAAIRSGEYTLTFESVTTAGRSTAVPVFAPLSCTSTGSATQECVNTRGTRTTPIPTLSPRSQ